MCQFDNETIRQIEVGNCEERSEKKQFGIKHNFLFLIETLSNYRIIELSNCRIVYLI
jgi:hypothetical protein